LEHYFTGRNSVNPPYSKPIWNVCEVKSGLRKEGERERVHFKVGSLGCEYLV